MAVFAEIDPDRNVIRSIEVLERECLDAEGNHQESVGIAFCRALYGPQTYWREAFYEEPDTGLWVQDASRRLWIPAT